MVIHACSPSPWGVEGGGSKVQDHPLIHSEFKTSLGYMRHNLYKKKNYKYKMSMETEVQSLTLRLAGGW